MSTLTFGTHPSILTYHSTRSKMTPEEIQKILDGYNEVNTNELSDEAIEQRYWARESKDKEKTRQHYKTLGDECVRTGRIVEVSRKGGKTVTDKKKERILEHNKAKRALTDEQVIEMKEIYRNDISVGFPELAKMYGVDSVTIHNIMNGKTYQGVGGDVVVRTPLYKCPYCDKPPMTKTNLERWHGNECKKKPQ